MILQRLRLPGEKRTRALYWRAKGEVRSEGESFHEEIRMSEGSVLGLDTYFNSFSCGKWSDYTEVTSVSFRVRGRGRIRVSLYYACLRGEQIRRIRVFDGILEIGTQEGDATAPVGLAGYRTGSLYAVIRALEPSVLAGGGWETDVRRENPVRLAAVICTYRKEAYVRRNLAVVRELLRDGEGALQDGTLSAVCIVDNGRTLADPGIPGLSLIPNRNTGGSGGFERGMREMGDGGYTHLLLMDDDIVIEPEAIRRTRAFLSCEKPEYRMRLLGGAMLRMDQPYIQHEAGGVWNHGRIHSLHQGYDLRSLKFVLRNEQREDGRARADYAAWWYCCIPAAYVRKHGYPMPFFYHCDDIEYSLRGRSEPLFLNGIAVWHEPFENKRSSAAEYYDVRNMLFTNRRHCPEYGRKEEIFGVLYKVYANLIRYRYRDAGLVLRAVRDFRRGETWLSEVGAEALHEEIIRMGYRMRPIVQARDRRKLTGKDLYRRPRGLRKCRNLLTLNGYLLPAKRGGRRRIRIGDAPDRYYRVKEAVLYDPDTGKGFVVRRSRLKAVRYLLQTAAVLIRYDPVIGRLWDAIRYPKAWSIRSDWTAHVRIFGRRILAFLGLSRLNPAMAAIEALKDRHSGERCFIVGTGASLRYQDLERLRGEITFSMNSILLAYPNTTWRPTYYAVADYYGYEQDLKDYMGENWGDYCRRELLLHHRVRPARPCGREIYFLIHHGNHTKSRRKRRRFRQEENIAVCIYDCFTVTNMLLDIALYMGFTEIYLLGVDCNYEQEKKHIEETPADQRRIREPDYLLPRTDLMEEGYRVLQRMAEKKKAVIRNATRGGSLEVFPRVRLEEIVGKEGESE